MPNSSTMLDVVATNKGVLLPRVELTSSTDATTIVPQNKVGLLVFNTTAAADIGVGYHFWDGAKWVAMYGDGLSSATGDPNTNGTTGGAGDIYVDESTGDIYVNDGNTWVNTSETTTTLVDNGNGTFTYTSEDGTATTFNTTQSGTGDPNTNGTTGGAGDIYVDESTGDIYVHNGTNWVPVSASETTTTLVDNGNGTFTYTSEDGTLYIGVTNNLNRRISEHSSGVGGLFSARYNLKRLVYFETFRDVRVAIAREKQLKRWHRQWKINLIESINPDWKDLML